MVFRLGRVARRAAGKQQTSQLRRSSKARRSFQSRNKAAQGPSFRRRTSAGRNRCREYFDRGYAKGFDEGYARGLEDGMRESDDSAALRPPEPQVPQEWPQEWTETGNTETVEDGEREDRLL